MGILTLDKAVFLDKDGTLLVNVPYNVDPALMQFTPHAGEALRLLQQAGYRLFVISNQSGVARGMFTEAALQPVHRQLRKMLADEGVTLGGFYYCPHHPEGTVKEYAASCFCRKPSPGMLFRAARDHGLDLPTSWMIGDILDDVECGQRASCTTILVDSGSEKEWKRGPKRQPHFTATNMLEAAEIVLKNSRPDEGIPLPKHLKNQDASTGKMK